MNAASVTTSDRAEGKKHDMSLMTEGEKPETTQKVNLFGITQRLQKLQEKLGMEYENYKEIRVIGVLGMAGIGKTTLTKKLFEEGKSKFHRRIFFEDLHKISKENWSTELRVRLLEKFLKKKNLTISKETTHESLEKELLESKVFLVLDDLSDKEQLEYLLGNRKWIKQGSKIVIVTSDKSLVEGLVDDTYVVPGLNEREGLACFCHHALGDNKVNSVHEGNLMKLSREFVDYARGNPLALKVLGVELHDRDEAHWEAKLQSHKFVTALVDSESGKGRSQIKDLADKFLIDISAGRVEMHGLLYRLGMKLASQPQQRLCNHQDIIRVLKKKPGKIIISGIRGMFLDMSEVVNKTPLGKEAFDGMNNLQYLKFYNSCFPRDSEADCKLNFPDGLKLPLQEIRYFHWLRFPEEELPQHFNPKNLVDLKLPYSKIKRLWDGVKDTSNLKWVDLNHSVDLHDLSGLSKARNLQRLNLEGCTSLKELHDGMQNLTSLVVLNLRGCTSLTSFVEMNMKSLKTLILSDCSNLEDFQVISEHLEALYLDGTALKRLPQSIIKLQKLVLLNMKDCKMLATVPDCLGNMKALQEVILSGCSRLESFPDLQENMRRLRIFLLDGTSIKEVPKLLQDPGLSEWPHHGVKGLPLLRHLCLRGNDMIKTLQPHIGQLYHLKYIDLKHCKNLMSVPTLPPNLQHLNAHGCESLTTLGDPLAFLVLTDQNHSTFVFSNCNKLDEVAKTSIISYIQKKSHLMSDAIDRYNLGSVVESFAGACFPGCEVPAWLSHQAYGSVIVLPELSRHWSNNGTTGVALCAVVSFTDQTHRFLVKCTCEFKNADGSLRRFICTVGGTEPQKIESDHVFIGYTSWLQIKKQKQQEDDKKGYSYSDDHYQASLRFEVTDGTGEVVEKCQVVKCGFSLVYESDENESVSWEVNSNPTIHSESMLPADSGKIEVIVGAESQTMEEITQHCETTNIHGLSISPADSEMEEINQQGNNIINGVMMIPSDSEESEVDFSDGLQRIEVTNRNGETSSCVSTEDHGYGADVQSSGNDSLFSFTDNASVQMMKPIGIICLMISISAGAAFMLGKRKRKM
ncbi:unnamed protein product [Microthlaspi erraticum]|nr:unnamed protein product [Microthlaspi erraticum]